MFILKIRYLDFALHLIVEMKFSNGKMTNLVVNSAEEYIVLKIKN